MKKILPLLTAAGLLASAGEPVKLIELSWSSPDTDFLRKHISVMEADSPYDGIGINLKAEGTVDGKIVQCGYDRISSSVPWKYEWFSKAIDDLKKTPFRKFTDNFLRANLGGTAWTDDRSWEIYCGNFALLARIARETGMKGLAVDPEMYGNRLFTFSPAYRLTPEQAYAAARRRGVEFGKALFTEFPGIRLIFLLGWMEACGPLPGRSSGYNYEVLRPFLNGLYEVMPDSAMFFDGCENASYNAADEADFCYLAMQYHRQLKDGVEPGLRGKFERNTRFAPALYLDRFFRNGNGIGAFTRALYGANRYSDGYIWTWGERGSWWPTADLVADPRWKAAFLWKDKSPELPRMIGLILDPRKNALSAASFLKKTDLPNDGMAEGMKHWELWSRDKSKGELRIRKDSVLIENVKSRSCIHRTVKLQEGKLYLLTARVETNMDNAADRMNFFVGWRKGMKWNNPARHHICEFRKSGKDSEYTAAGIFRVPAGSDASLQFGLTAQDQGEYAAFKGISLYCLD